ncbi:MAG TPA: hypothetical protein VNK04_25865 [Gemmataceae bacterium]|nr:hypothetical protein [Gemmataceae bacterium]
MSARPWLFASVVALGLLGTTGGCQTPGRNPDSANALVSSDAGAASATGNGLSSPTTGREPEGGGLLRTGAILLGPGVGRNWWRWQGDGLWGF